MPRPKPGSIHPRTLSKISELAEEKGYASDYDFLKTEYNNHNSMHIANLLHVAQENVTHNILPWFDIPVRGRGGRRWKNPEPDQNIKPCVWSGCKELRRDDGPYTRWCNYHLDAVNRICDRDDSEEYYGLTVSNSKFKRRQG